MSIGSLGIIGGLAGTPLPQRAAETEKTQRDNADQSRVSQAAERAEQAAGIGQTEEDSQANERDADGRRPWEQPPIAQSRRRNNRRQTIRCTGVVRTQPAPAVHNSTSTAERSEDF